MLDHAFVHSVFGIHSSFEFRISSFSRLQGLPSEPTRDQTGPNGTPFGPEKDTILPCPADAKKRPFAPARGVLSRHDNPLARRWIAASLNSFVNCRRDKPPPLDGIFTPFAEW